VAARSSWLCEAWLPAGSLARTSRPFALVVLAPLARSAGLGSLSKEPVSKAPPLLIARHRESIARIAMLASGAPVAAAPVAACRSPGRERRPLLVLRLPQPAAREPSQHRIGMACLQLPQRRQQLLLRVRTERGRFALEDDRPVGVTWGHVLGCSVGRSFGQ
jgi:hypothetical protein